VDLLLQTAHRLQAIALPVLPQRLVPLAGGLGIMALGPVIVVLVPGGVAVAQGGIAGMIS